MARHLISLMDLPADGKEFLLTDQDIWLDSLREFKMDCRIVDPLEMKATVRGAESGCLVRGELTGGVVVPCNRCAEDARVAIDANFEEYEEIPEEENKTGAAHGKNEETHIIFEKGQPMLDLGEVAWEQFMLAMPVKPLCRTECKGLCPTCGANLNLGPCGCQPAGDDPRMAPLRNLAIKR